MSSNLKALADKGEARCALVPKLRFPDFQDAREWEVSTIGDSKPFVTSGSRGWATFYSENGDLFVRITNLLRDSIYLDLTDSKYVQLPPGANEGVRTQLKEHDVLISITADIGIIGYVDEYIPSPAYINQHIALVRFDEEQLCGKYVAYFLAAEKSQKLFRASTDTGTKAGMSLIGIQKIMIMFPGLPEQQKIADCLSSMDELIAAQARKVDALKTYKKGLMQQLFPRKGETQPRLRFPEFQNDGEWEVKAIGNVFKVTRGEVLSMKLVQDEASDEAPFPVYSSQTINKGLAGYYSEYLYQDAITWTTDGANAGDVNFRPGKFYCTNVCGVLINPNGCANPCVAALLNSITRSHVSYVGNPKLMNGVMAKIEIPFPSVAEQYRIAKFLSSLDNLITTETQKHEAIKTHQKGLMQQLFPSIEYQS